MGSLSWLQNVQNRQIENICLLQINVYGVGQVLFRQFKAGIVPLAVARAFNMKIVCHIPKEEFEGE